MNTRTKDITISRSRVFLYGFLAWTFWILFYSVIFKIQTQITWPLALFISAENYYVFAVISIGIWMICRKIPFGSMPLPVLIFIHFLIGILCSALWIFLTFGLWYLFEGKKVLNEYMIHTVLGWEFLFGVMTYFMIAGIYYTIIYYKQYREKELRETELKLLTRDSELKALKAQINPHFLFNSLNSINALVTQNPKLARKMIARLSELLRVTLETRDMMMVPLKEELDFAHLYLDIERIRFGDRMDFQEKVEPDLLGISFPAMILQPLLENAVKHGIADHRGIGNIRLVLNKQNDSIVCTVTNSVTKKIIKKGMDLTVNGTGLQNIRKRLDLFYSNEYDFRAGYSNSGDFEVQLLLPVMSDEKNQSSDH